MRIEADGFSQRQKFSYVDPPLPTLDVSNERLVAAEPLGDNRLVKTGLLPIFDYEPCEPCMPS